MLTATCGFEVSVTLVPQIARTTFLAFGDSVTEGEVTVPAAAPAGAAPILRQVVVPSASYPTVIESRLAERYRAQRVTIENAGRSRGWAADALPRFRAALATSRPGAVLLLMGYNEPGSSAQRREAVAALDRMAKEARAAGARVFIATLTPGVDGRERAPNPLAVLAMNDALRALAAGESAVDGGTVVAAPGDASGGRPRR